MLMLVFALISTPTHAQDVLTIGGDVYGGGKNGAVGTENNTTATETDSTSITLDDATLAVTSVRIQNGTIRTVFGGGENGRSYGQTNVSISGSTTQIGADRWTGTIHGGVFGAGDGWKAHVYGGSNVTITNGTIVGNVYGGGNVAALMGKTHVVLQGGDFQGNVFGGARMANIFGYSHVNVDGQNAENNLIVNGVYGGNDISGNINKPSGVWQWVTALMKPTDLVKADDYGITDAYNAFVQVTPQNADEANRKKLYIGQLYGGGNGAYDYTVDGSVRKLEILTGDVDDPETTEIDESQNTQLFTNLQLPEVDNVYLELRGGTYGYVYGGGNNATVKVNTNICIDNNDDITHAGTEAGAIVDDTRLHAMGINLTTFTNTRQFIRVFGGNNIATMDIRPTWHLNAGEIHNLYSGGNQGNMTNPDGILLAVTGQDMTVDNVYGGCRMADVDPGETQGEGLAIAAETTTTPAYTFPAGYSAKVYIGGGKIYNVYGGNDVSGNVYGGTNVEIHHSIIGDVYGGGNGSYAYTDNASLRTDEMYGDFYYPIPTGKTSAQALNMHRPNVENTLVHVAGHLDDDDNPVYTYIGGALYCGGNSATLRKIGSHTLAENDGTAARLDIGSYVIANSMFLGSNGENMVRGTVQEFNFDDETDTWTENTVDILQKYAETSPNDFSQMDLTTTTDFEEYMRGVEVAIKPDVTFDTDYVPFSSKVGSLYCGGNVGSMSADGYFNVSFLNSLVIFEKLVGGCNNANVEAGTYNAFHEGGLTTHNDNKVTITIDGLRLEPRKLTYDAAANTYSFDWNKTAENMLIGGNVYGGCYASGYINGGVTINLRADAIEPDVRTAADGTTLQLLTTHRDSVLNTALSIFGAGYGQDAEIWGNTQINITDNADIVKVFGGGEMGVVGSLVRNADGSRTGDIESAYNTTISLRAGNVGKIYGGGFEGPVTGHTTVNLLGGTAYDVIGGACNADIEEYAETYIGSSEIHDIPTITNNVYGANDFGGRIKGTHNFASRVSTTAENKVYNTSLLSAASYVEYVKGRANYIFGGAKAAYDYKNQTYYAAYADNTGKARTGFDKPAIGNAFVNFRPEYAELSSIQRVYGAGQGYFNELDKDLLQDNSYVLIDIPDGDEQFASLEVFGAGDYSGVGINVPAATVRTNEAATTDDVTAAAVIDLIRGNVNSVYGGSYKQGFTRRTIVNVPVGSTIDMNYLYGGAYGVEQADGNTLGNLYPCDVYESNVNYKSGTARCRTIYGGNNSYRRTLYTHVNIHTPVRYVHRTYGLTHANIFGAGYGENTWAQYTEINLVDSARVYEPYGGGEAGNVYNKESITQLASTTGWSLAIPGDYLTTDAAYDHGGLDNVLAHSNQLYADFNPVPDADDNGTPDINVAEKYNTNVHINQGATVVNYAYGAGFGSHIYTYELQEIPKATEPQYGDYKDGAKTLEDLDADAQDRYNAALTAYDTYMAYTVGQTVHGGEYNTFTDEQKAQWKQIDHRTTAVVSGTSYIDLLGGTVTKDLYAAGTTGAVQDTLRLGTFTATSTAYVKGGMARNVYGGGWEGPVGKHDISKGGTYLTEDELGVAHVIVGRPEEDIAADYTVAVAADPSTDKEQFYFLNGVPAITRNAYAGGEGGVIRGTANLNIFNGLIGYRFKNKSDITSAELNAYKIVTDSNGAITYQPINTANDDLTAETFLYVEEVDQDTIGDNVMYEAGNAFGGGYAANSDVDISNITLWNGIVRNSMYGGGEIATIGRGILSKSGDNYQAVIYKPGETHVTMMGGHVLRDVFGGGRGFNNWKTEDKSDGNTNGFIFGQTDVNIHYGTIGTHDGVSKGYGNVFGGGNIGFVYSHYTERDANGWYYKDSEHTQLSEDTRVEVKVYGKALADVTIGGTPYKTGAFIPNTDLDKLTKENKAEWAKVDQSGIVIYNAVFAGGNVSAGSDKIMAFSKTVYGNSTASVVDIYGRDLVSVGGSGVGGLYGDGNLTFVDGYRELNITNYGTDYFSLTGGLSEAEFNELTPRQQSFYITRYICNTAYDSYEVGDIILSDVYSNVADANKDKWTRGQSIVNEGRYINTIQRCDFCGIKGSRLVLHGAIDRAQDESEADYTNYTINRVGELSLNQNHQSGQEDHGSYFGIYNVVKFLGGITSDVLFEGDTEHPAAIRTTDSAGAGYEVDGSTFFAWKKAHLSDNTRNDGSSPNKIALSSGVFLEIVKELDYSGNKVYGPITGVVELDLLNVSPGEGGGYVYAQNIHGTPHYAHKFADVISNANKNLVTNRAFTYDAATASDDMQTSGNFVHSLPKRILDDCFPESKKYAGASASPAHYWYIRGEFYVYDQLVSAYTGGADAYNTEMSIPLTMSIQGNAKLRLLNVVPGLYADPAKLLLKSYNADDPDLSVSDSISIVSNAVIKTYGQGDPISYWDWYNATKAEREMFVVEKDAVVCNTEATFEVSGTDRTYYPGEAINIAEYNAIKNLVGKNAYGDVVKADTLFSVINEVNTANGYLLTVDMSNPSKWDDYYRLIDSSIDDPIKKAKYLEMLSGLTGADRDEFIKKYVKGATFTCNVSGTYGQYYFRTDDVISHNIYSMQTEDVKNHATESQALFDEAYIAKENCEVMFNGRMKSFAMGTPISLSWLNDSIDAADRVNFENAYICVSTVLVKNGDYRVLNQLVGESEYNGSDWSDDVKAKFQQAYYCTKEGSWGGKYYEEGKNYNAVDYGQLLVEERERVTDGKHLFSFNYDALDVLLYNNYVDKQSAGSYAYDVKSDYTDFIDRIGGSNHNAAISVFDKAPATNPFYSISARLDYTATFNSEETADQFKYVKDGASKSMTKGVTLNNEEYESLPNDRKYYASFAVDDQHHVGDVYRTYIVKNTFDVAGRMYNAGMSITAANYSELTEQQQKNVQVVEIPYIEDGTTYHGAGTYFFCIEKYTVGANDDNITKMNGTAVVTPTVEAIDRTTEYAKGAEVPVGTIINSAIMLGIPDYQSHFDITGEIPIEETTLYVPSSADIAALQRDRYVTAIFEYSYTESSADGMKYETRIEKHIVNIRIKFLSGVPVIGALKEPDLVLPLETVGLDIPAIQEGAFPILGGGWEIYPNEDNAKRHRNGREYVNGGEPLYFYENDYYVAYYALTRMGKTFSDAVPLHVANYQRMADVITDPHHMYINHRDNDRDPKIYINSRSTDTYGANITLNSTTYSNELDALQGVWSLVNTPSFGQEYAAEVDGQKRDVTGASGLEFFLQSEVNSQLPTWTSLGDDTHCFEGILHGNGNTITGLNNSLFGKLCGRVYNLGVMGSFTAGGIANTGDGRIENAWVWTSSDAASGKAVYADPGSDAKVINAYYPDVNTGFTGSTGDIEVTERPVEDFVNGAVAYDLNRYYLEARYRLNGGKIDGTIDDQLFYRLPDGTIVKDSEELTTDANGNKPEDDGYITTHPNKVYVINYADTDYARFRKQNSTNLVGYVEKYFDDGDFRFSDGLKPLNADIRLSSANGYIPIYPDDYIFFGQKLTYGILNDAGGNPIAHSTHPEAVAKLHTTGSNEDVDNSRHGLLILDATDRSENRVYRAPAYFRNGTYGQSVMFNSHAAFVDSYDYTIPGGSGTAQPHHGLTAIDFTGGNGDTKGYQGVVAGLASDFKNRANGYHPLLDYERLDAIQTQGITQNLLAYTPKADIAGSKNAQTNTVLVNYFRDPSYAETDNTYRTVAVQNTNNIRGHVAQQVSTSIGSGATDYQYQSLVNHLLVDRNDFNAPMPYTFAANRRMWYQRRPDNYAQGATGWEAISLPFQAELVTTQDKGEISHFYNGSTTGHEYWLRQYEGVKADGDVATATMNYPDKGSNTKNYTNTFLYDYYYSKDDFDDKNTDDYQSQYYNTTHRYTDYPYSEVALPYIVGFPGARYYEFDLSGEWTPLHRVNDVTIDNPGAQTVTFVSPLGITVGKSDTELNDQQVEKGGYIFTPSYLNTDVAGDSKSYVLNADGSSFDITDAATTVDAFRPYFVKKSAGAKARRIVFGQANSSVGDNGKDGHKSGTADGALAIYAERSKIIVESTLSDATDVRIVTASGIQIKQFTIQPGETIETPVTSHGVYIVNNRKLMVR